MSSSITETDNWNKCDNTNHLFSVQKGATTLHSWRPTSPDQINYKTNCGISNEMTKILFHLNVN